jgi:methylated-DNA-protein-cysteine methyltransferase-like protein
MDNFFSNVYKVVRLIPPGKVTTYGAIAKCLGAPKSSRMVGWALNKVANSSEIPAHRVVNRNGILTGKNHFFEKNYMSNKLSQEKVEVVKNAIINLEEYFWDPIKELTL